METKAMCVYIVKKIRLTIWMLEYLYVLVLGSCTQ